MNNYTVIIIGAGPAGLAVAAQLAQQKVPYLVLERAPVISPAWRGHYDRLHLHTVKEMSHLPGLPFPDHYPRFISRQQLVDYLEEYATRFGIQPRFNTTVTAVTRMAEGDWAIATEQGEVYRTRHCVIATGVNRVPVIPSIPGLDTFAGKVMHSSEYKNGEPFTGQRVLTVGMGNSGAEIALDQSEYGVDAYLSVRGPVNIVPREIMGRSTQETAIRLAQLPNFVSDGLGVLLRWLLIGDLTPYGIETPETPPARQLREEGKTPVVDVGTVAAIRSGDIKVRPGIKRIEADTIVFTDDTAERFDAIVFATGFRAALAAFIPALDAAQLDKYGLPTSPIGSGTLAGLYFIGFDIYTPGGGLHVIRQEAPLIGAAIAEQKQIFAPTRRV